MRRGVSVDYPVPSGGVHGAISMPTACTLPTPSSGQGGYLTILLSDLPCHCTFNTWKVLFILDLGLFNPVRPAFTPVSSVIHFMLLSDFAIPMKGKVDDVDSDVLGRRVLNVSVC